MSYTFPSSSDRILNSRQLIKRRDELQEKRDELESATLDENGEPLADPEALAAATADLDAWDTDNADELAALVSVCEEGEGYCSDWRYGETLIREDYFTEYARELADDCDMLPHNRSWPLNCIDWEAAARELKADYTKLTFDGTTYLVRST